MDFGLQSDDLGEIVKIFQQCPAVEEAVIFGSRAKGNYRKGSDIDIAIKGKDIGYDDVTSLSFALNEDSNMPYYFDIVYFETISETALIDHINRVGRRIFLRQ